MSCSSVGWVWGQVGEAEGAALGSLERVRERERERARAASEKSLKGERKILGGYDK